MSNLEKTSGLPTIEQVREHAERYPATDMRGRIGVYDDAGQWCPSGMWRIDASPPYLVLLAAVSNQMRAAIQIGEVWISGLAVLSPGATPCDQAGNPLPMVERVKKAEDNYRFMVERAADQKLDGYRELGERLCAAVTRAETAERALNDMAKRSRYEDVRAFQVAMGLPVGDEAEPCAALAQDRAAVLLRARLIAEEFGELMAAMGISFSEMESVTEIMHSSAIRAGMADWTCTPHIDDTADALADLAYVVEGTAVEAGIDTEHVWREVHAANMRKVGGERREDGKLLKPAGWKQPDIAGVIARQVERARSR